jgi:hypothetical protein
MQDWTPGSVANLFAARLRGMSLRRVVQAQVFGRCLIALLGILAATACGGGSSASAPPPAGVPAAPASADVQSTTATNGPASPMMRLLPEQAGGWTRTGAPQRYGPDDLWEYIDGGADQYVSYGFQEVVAAKYSNAAGATATVDIYQMDEPAGAFGVYAQEDNPKATPVRLGVEGQAGTDSVRFWSANYYVKMVSTPPGKSSKDASVALGASVASGLGDPGAPPRELSLFPAKGLVAGSIRYIPANMLGQAGFSRGFEAKYAATPETSTLVIVPFQDPDGARVALGKYQAFLGQGGKPVSSASVPCDGSVLAHEKFSGLIFAARSGSWLAISLGSPDERAARALLTEVCGSLARFSPVSSRKVGVR